MTKSSLTIPALILAFGGGLAYWVMSNRDTTPVGLTITKTIENNGIIGKNGEDEYGVSIVEGTFRESDSTLPISSESEDRPLFVVSKNGETIEAKVVDKPEEKSVAAMELALEVAKKYELDTQDYFQERLDDLKKMEEDAQEAESVFGQTMTLQSHFVW